MNKKNKKNEKKIFYIKLSIIILFLYSCSVILSNINNFILYLKKINKIKDFETFYKFLTTILK